MRGPEKSKYLAEVLESVASSEEKLRKVEFELRNRVCGYYNQNEEITFDVESIHGKLEKVSKICEPRFENRDRPESLKAFDLIPCNVNKVGGILQIHETRSNEALMNLEAMKPICSDIIGVGALQVNKSELENNNFSSDFETSDNLSNPCNEEIRELLKIDEQNLESTNGYVTFKSVAHNHLHTGDGEEALQIYLLPQIDRQEVSNHNGHLESLDLIPRRDKINLQNLALETGTTKAIDLIPRHENDLQIKEKDSGLNQDILNNFEQTVHTNSQIHVGDEKISESLEQKLETDHKKKIQNNNIKVLVDKIHSAVECRLKQCLEPYRSRKQRGPFTLNKIDTEKHLLNGIDKNCFGDGLRKLNSENGSGMEFVEKLFASYYQRERERKEDTERGEIERENDKSQKLSRILDKIASKGLEKLLKGSHINNLTDELKMKENEKIEEKLESDEGKMAATNKNDEKITADGTKKENLILNKDGHGAGLKKEHRNRKTKSKKYENYLPTIGEKGESSCENERGNEKNRRKDARSNKKDTAKKFVEKIKSPYKPVQDDKKMKICLKRGGNKMKIVEKGDKKNRKIKKSPYSMSFDIKKRKKQGEPIRKKVIKKGCKKKMKIEENDEEQDSKIVCISLRNQEKEECDNEKQNTNEMFDIIKELVFRKNNVQEKVKSKKKKQKKRKEKEEGKEKGEKNVRKKKIDKPVWLVPDGHPDGFQPPKTKHRMSAHKLEFENFSEEDKQNKNSLSSDKFKMRREFVIFLDDKQNNIFGTKSAFRMPLKNC